MPSAPPRRNSRRHDTKLNLFAVNLNGNSDPEPNEEDDSDNDLPTWVRAIRQWPLYPSAPSKQERTLEEAKVTMNENQASVDVPIPLASLVNVEALLMDSGEETLEVPSTDLGLVESASHMVNIAAPAGMVEPSNETNETMALRGKATPLSILSRLEALKWNEMVGSMQRSLLDITGAATSSTISNTTDAILREATKNLETLVGEASKISPSAVIDLVQRAGLAVRRGDAAAEDLEAVAEQMAREGGLNVSEAATQARQVTKVTSNLVAMANALLVAGFVDRGGDEDDDVEVDAAARPLFADFSTAKAVTPSKFRTTVAKAAEMGTLAGAIYQDTIPRTLDLGHAIVANGTTEDVAWMVTDCVAYHDEFQETNRLFGKRERNPVFVRTITVRGFDASDETVDRELLLNRICTATPEMLNEERGVLLHSGLLEIARAVYKDIGKYVYLTGPTHRLVFNGHSVGGSISVLLLLLMAEDRGAEFVRDKVLRVFTFGSPPVAKRTGGRASSLINADGNDDHLRVLSGIPSDPELRIYGCDILSAFELPNSIVYGFVQPWDPIVRLFSDIDPLYPLLEDIGEDGKTLYSSGPPRSLRAITRAIIESWEGWPRFRDNFRDTVNQNYTSVGIQHILLPEPVRYLTDRLVSVNVGVPPVDGMLRVSSSQLLPALAATFPLSVFSISFIPAAIRSFVHHFYPAYGFPIVDFASKKRAMSSVSNRLNELEREDYERVLHDVEDTLLDNKAVRGKTDKGDKKGGGGLGWAAPWQFQKEY